MTTKNLPIKRYVLFDKGSQVGTFRTRKAAEQCRIELAKKKYPGLDKILGRPLGHPFLVIGVV